MTPAFSSSASSLFLLRRGCSPPASLPRSKFLRHVSLTQSEAELAMLYKDMFVARMGAIIGYLEIDRSGPEPPDKLEQIQWKS
ncbi:hypothetical protein Forpi1262_v016874 [Fusarium oxysporum f. sp. raphani]|uniref:Uncharacterized protein n=1 Tax=Fusarium oxysporum f. sp. raphani TaxID=96318 RepID=A0A8J5NYQ1_FUSOX|nr:hypothetical protein Forpi1262_v016874 [Fusarium oxysporum f. sp. raphani]